MTDSYDAMKAQKDAIVARDKAFLTRVYDIIAGINDGIEVGADGYARLASLNDRDQLQTLCDELGAQTRFSLKAGDND